MSNRIRLRNFRFTLLYKSTARQRCMRNTGYSTGCNGSRASLHADRSPTSSRSAQLYAADTSSCLLQKMQWLCDVSAGACREHGGRGCINASQRSCMYCPGSTSSVSRGCCHGRCAASDIHPSWGYRGVLLPCLSPGCKEQKHMLVDVQNVRSVQHQQSRLALRCASVFVECVAEIVHARQRECTTEIVYFRTELLELLGMGYHLRIPRGAAAQLTGLVPAGAVSGPQAGTVTMQLTNQLH